MERKSVELDAKQKEMKKLEGTERGGTNVLILIFSFWNAVPYNMAASAGGDRI